MCLDITSEIQIIFVHLCTATYLYADTRQLQMYQAILRMKYSSLNNHLYMRNIVNSHLCQCGNIETNLHFICKCPFYTDGGLNLKTANQHYCLEMSFFLRH